MNSRTLSVAAFITAFPLAFQGANCAHGQTIPIQTFKEPVFASLSSVPPTNAYDKAWSQEPSDNPNHRFRFNFSGTFTNTSLTAPTSVIFWNGYLLPTDPPGTPPHKGGSLHIDLMPGQSKVYSETDTLTSIDFGFVPPVVTVHYENAGPGAPATIDGVFLRQIYAIPEPCSSAICGVCVLAVIGAVRRRR